MPMLRSLRSLLPFILTSFGFILIALVINMPLLEWQISDIATNLPAGVQIHPTWTTKFGDSLKSGSYNAEDGAYIFHQVLFSNNGNSCSPQQLTSVVRRSQSDERLEQLELTVNHGMALWLTGLTQTGQITMAVLLLLCGIHIWWFIIRYNRPIAEAFILAIVAVVLLGFLINVWRILVPETGVFVCRPLIHGTVTINAVLSKIHYETLIILLAGILAELAALSVILREVLKVIFERNKALN